MPRKTNPTPLQRASAANARAARLGTPEQATAARAEFNAEKIATFIERTLQDAPPLTAEQRVRLARLLTAESAK